MIPTVLIIEEMKRREQERQRMDHVPLHAPSPSAPSGREETDGNEGEEKVGGTVIIIDMVDHTVTRI